MQEYLTKSERIQSYIKEVLGDEKKHSTREITEYVDSKLKENGEFVDKWMGFFHDAEFYNYKTILSFDEEGNMQWSAPEKYFAEYREIEKL